MEQKIKDFKKEIEEVCKKYEICIVNEDSYCGFELTNYSEENMEYVMEARNEVRN